MTATRVVTDHQELDNSGQVSHRDLDSYVETTPWIVVSGASGAIPPGARKLVGSGITVTDGGPGGDLTIVASSSLPTPTFVGAILMAVTTSSFSLALPLATQAGVLINDNGYIIVSASL